MGYSSFVVGGPLCKAVLAMVKRGYIYIFFCSDLCSTGLFEGIFYG